MIDTLDNFWAAIGILVAVATIYVLFRIAHPYSEGAKNVIGSHLVGCLADAGIWFVIVLITSQLALNNPPLGYVFMRVIGTSFLNVQFVTWSMLLVPLSFSVHKAYPRFDYRPWAIGIMCIVAFVLGLYYWNPATFLPQP
jgi:hypothetical protein